MSATNPIKPILEGMINYQEYPINAQGSEAYNQLVERLRVGLREKGSVSMPDFLTKAGVELLQCTVENKMPEANYTQRRGNVFDMPIPEGLPKDHALQIELESSYYSLGREQLQDTFIEALYTYEDIRKFAADVLEIPKLYYNDDPYNACVVMMYGPGDKIDWHFDYGHFVCLINIYEISDGGFHECAADIRTEENNCYEEVAKVLHGDTSRVLQSRSSPGAFTIFKGRYSLHRVTEVTGSEMRKSLVMTYEEKTGVVLDDEVRQRYFNNK